MSPVLKICGFIAVFALAVLANPINEFDETNSQSKDQILQSNEFMNEEPGSPAETSSEDSSDKGDEQTTLESASELPADSAPDLASESASASASESTPDLASESAPEPTPSAPSAENTMPMRPSTASKPRADGDEVTTAAAATTMATTTEGKKGNNSSSLTYPNKILSFAAIMFMLIVKML